MVSYVSGSKQGKITGFLTSMTNPVAYPLEDLLRVYWARWEIELGYDELKRRQLKGETTLRSRFPEGGAVGRYSRLQSAEERDGGHRRRSGGSANPDKLYCGAEHTGVSGTSLWQRGGAGNIPYHLKDMRENVKAFALPEKESTEGMTAWCFLYHLNIRQL
jgi:hypothetical protein